jgi:hypothetical protein
MNSAARGCNQWVGEPPATGGDFGGTHRDHAHCPTMKRCRPPPARIRGSPGSAAPGANGHCLPRSGWQDGCDGCDGCYGVSPQLLGRRTAS